jgi:DNA-binding NtrC family response regulator
MDLMSTKRHVLVVEDDRELCSLIVVMLTEAGYRTDCAYDAEEAFARLNSRLPTDLVVTDLNLPGKIQGEDVAHVAAAKGHGVVIVTGRETHSSTLARYRLVKKPFTSEKLLDAVSHALATRRGSA